MKNLIPPHFNSTEIIKDTYMDVNYDYWCWDNYFTSSEIKKFNRQIKKNILGEEDLSLAAISSTDKQLKKLKTEIVSLSKISKFVQPLMRDIHYCNEKIFKYNLYINSQLEDTGNYNTYSSKIKSEYKWHIDESRDMRFDVKFTVLINLSEQKYTGGGFKIFKQEAYTVDRFKTPGSVLMFKSHLHHCVRPVLSGERRTFTIFIPGPKWK